MPAPGASCKYPPSTCSDPDAPLSRSSATARRSAYPPPFGRPSSFATRPGRRLLQEPSRCAPPRAHRMRAQRPHCALGPAPWHKGHEAAFVGHIQGIRLETSGVIHATGQNRRYIPNGQRRPGVQQDGRLCGQPAASLAVSAGRATGRQAYAVHRASALWDRPAPIDGHGAIPDASHAENIIVKPCAGKRQARFERDYMETGRLPGGTMP